jgi:hypothetical protein
MSTQDWAEFEQAFDAQEEQELSTLEETSQQEAFEGESFDLSNPEAFETATDVGTAEATTEYTPDLEEDLTDDSNADLAAEERTDDAITS